MRGAARRFATSLPHLNRCVAGCWPSGDRRIAGARRGSWARPASRSPGHRVRKFDRPSLCRRAGDPQYSFQAPLANLLRVPQAHLEMQRLNSVASSFHLARRCCETMRPTCIEPLRAVNPPERWRS
jgi:hypothetical protein